MNQINKQVNLVEKIQINGGIRINVDVSEKESCMWKRLYLELCSSSIMDESTIICDEEIKSYNEEIKTILTNFNEKKVTCKRQNFYVLLAFLLFTVTLLIAVSVYCYLI